MFSPGVWCIGLSLNLFGLFCPDIAEQGNGKAQNNLGYMYLHGEGVPQDFVLAHMWSNLGASRLPPGADRNVAVSIRENAEKRMTPDQVAEAQRLAREWKPK